jgi:hypothetical protein
MKTLSSKIVLSLGLALASLSGHAAVGTATTPNVTNLGNVVSPSSFTYSNTFSGITTQKFYDDYTFSLSPASSFSSITASIELGSFFGINNISVRLFQGGGPFAAGVTPIVQVWSTPFNAAPGVTGSVSVTNVAALASNTYTLEVRGDVVGSLGGSYTGSVNVVPVPEPETYALLLAGLGLMGTIAKRRKGIPA